jgi:hypothetical protein
LNKVLPASERQRLSDYEQEATTAGSDRASEWHRALRCARWAEQVVSAPEHNHLVTAAERALEVTEEVAETIGWEAIDLTRIPFGRGVSPRWEAELRWVEEAVDVARQVGEKSGWEKVPWEQLVQELLEIRPSR